MRYYCDEDITIPGHEKVQHIQEAQVYIVTYGDGSILRAVEFLVKNNCTDVPILGVNTGHVGFLSNNITLEEAGNLMSINGGDWHNPGTIHFVSQRPLLQVNVLNGPTKICLNDLSVHPKYVGRLFNISVLIEGEEIIYSGDGLVISTTSGSTAYNLSAGGPIISPKLNAICLTPLNAFSMASRSLIVPGNSKIVVRPEDNAVVAFDGVQMELRKDQVFVVGKSDMHVTLIKKNSFISDIQEKLGWNNPIKR